MTRTNLVTIISSSVRGRARFKIPRLYRSEPLKRYLESKLSNNNKIREMSLSTITGSVLVYFNSHNSSHSISLYIEELLITYEKNNGSHSVRVVSGEITQKVQKSQRDKRGSAATDRKVRKLVKASDVQKVELWHTMEADAVIALVESSKNRGLSGNEARNRLKKYGPNLLPESVLRSGLGIFIDQFKSLPVGLLTSAACLSVVTGGVADAAAIMSVVTINAIIGYVTESKAEKTIHSLKSAVRPSALVLRDGRVQEIMSEEVVIGDVLVLKPGSYVSADARVLEAENLSIDESALTGESMPVVKSGKPLTEGATPLADRINMVYMGTLVTGGQGLAVVVATAKFTEMGHIQTLVGDVKPPETPMERQLNTVGNQLVYICSGVCGLVFAMGLLRGYGFIQMLKIGISLAVAAVPEGLPALATTILAFGVSQMRRHNVLIRHLEAVETLGSVQILCLDKTGTVTLNKMSVTAIYTGGKEVIFCDGQLVTEDKSMNPHQCEELIRLIHICSLCNESEVALEQEGQYIVNGSSTEIAMIYMAISAGIDVISLRKEYPVMEINHRSENRNFMITHHELVDRGRLIAVKGSPVEVLTMCHWHIANGTKLPLTDDDRARIQSENEVMAGNALRVLGVAYKHNGDDMEDINGEDDLIWLGLVGMADPVRRGVKNLMHLFHRAGIDTVMITGDQSPTAYAIGKELNLSNGEQLEILDSSHITDIEPEVLKALAPKAHVFARVSPAHKLQIVQALQSSGQVVAMTGDGINDAPALKAADIGITMGHTGTDVAREVADVVLENDNLETMIIAVSQGRTIYKNIRKSIHYLLSTNLSEIIVSFATIAAGTGHPLSAIQLLWINILSDIWPGLALSFEPPEPDVLSQPPRDPDEPIIKRADLKRMTFESAMLSAGALGSYGYGIMRYGSSPRANTMAFTSLTIGQLIHALSCRSDKTSIFDKDKLPPNRHLTFALTASLGLQVLSMVVPGLRNFLGITPINIIDGIAIGSGALLPFIINEGTKKWKGDKENEK